MPYKLRWEGHGVYRRFFGVVSSAEFREAHVEMTGDLRYECIRYIISDYLEAEPYCAYVPPAWKGECTFDEATVEAGVDEA